MKIAFVNDVHIGKDAVKNGFVRAASSKALSQFPEVLDRILQQHQPDLLVDLGDLIRSESIEQDKKNYQEAIELFKDIKIPVIHLVGNHEVKLLQLSDIQNAWRANGIEQMPFGSKILNDMRFIWLDFEQQKTGSGIQTILASERLSWLDEELSNRKLSTIVLSHYVLTDQNLDGNFYFEKPLDVYTRYNNRDEILNVLRKHPDVIGVFSAHTHGMNYRIIDFIHHLTLPAMVENIAAPDINDNFPEIYTILTLKRNKMEVKCYSRQYCFLTIEL